MTADAAPQLDGCTITLPEFEGPLDLLLHLIHPFGMHHPVCPAQEAIRHLKR